MINKEEALRRRNLVLHQRSYLEQQDKTVKIATHQVVCESPPRIDGKPQSRSFSFPSTRVRLASGELPLKSTSAANAGQNGNHTYQSSLLAEKRTSISTSLTNSKPDDNVKNKTNSLTSRVNKQQVRNVALQPQQHPSTTTMTTSQNKPTAVSSNKSVLDRLFTTTTSKSMVNTGASTTASIRTESLRTATTAIHEQALQPTVVSKVASVAIPLTTHGYNGVDDEQFRQTNETGKSSEVRSLSAAAAAAAAVVPVTGKYTTAVNATPMLAARSGLLSTFSRAGKVANSADIPTNSREKGKLHQTSKQR